MAKNRQSIITRHYSNRDYLTSKGTQKTSDYSLLGNKDHKYTNGYVNGYTNGFKNDYPNGFTNGYTNSYTNGFTNDYTNSYSNGLTNGYSNGFTNGYSNGYKTNGYSNGYSTNGYANGFTSNYPNGYKNGYTNKSLATTATTTDTSIVASDHFNSHNPDAAIYEYKSIHKDLLPVHRSTNLGVHFNGENFALLSDKLTINDSLNLAFQFRTTVSNGLLMIIVDPETKNSFHVELVDSQLKATLFIDGEPDSAWSDFPTKVLSNYIWIDVNITITGNTITMKVKDRVYIKRHRNSLNIAIHGDLYIAGHSCIVKPPHALRSKNFYIGELRHFVVNNQPICWYGTPDQLFARLRKWGSD